MPTSTAVERAYSARFILVLAFLALVLIGGGSARADVLSLLFVRPAAVLLIAALLVLKAPIEWSSIRIPLGLLVGLGLLMLLQLAPLPPDLWLSLPGHARYAPAMDVFAPDRPWRPITLTPDLTLNSLLALLPPLAALIGFGSLRRTDRQRLVPVLILGVLASAILGVLQAGGGPNSPFYTYSVTNPGTPTGFLANRNHQALFLACAFPLLSLWIQMPAKSATWFRRRQMLAAGFALFVFAMLLVSGSRAGAAIAFGTIAASAFLGPRSLASRWSRSRVKKWAGVVGLGLVVGFTAIVVLAGRAVSLQRFLAPNLVAEDPRFTNLPTVLGIVRNTFPIGTGFGSFDPVFRGYEADALLSRYYFNHAHNDLLELVMTGGIAGAVLLAVLLIWLFSAGTRLLRNKEASISRRSLPAAGFVIALALLAGSIVDYPLRTPLMSVVFALACAWIAGAPKQGEIPAAA